MSYKIDTEECVNIMSSEGHELTFTKDKLTKQHKIILKDILGNELFDYRCDTFNTGNFIYHLNRGIKKFSTHKNSKKLVISRWYPEVHKSFFINLVKYPYISTTLYYKGNVLTVAMNVHMNSKMEIKFVYPVDMIKKIIS